MLKARFLEAYNVEMGRRSSPLAPDPTMIVV